ncbi:hypothetical protein OUZ56_003109 [Daphnia magna]|uniref:Uncharacterized protein n=1 Tax=Daphnia magna TaxID=35525 RepID=A0ABR0A881_9CRUS|nr:hypothetical protein OUZ56_003109 [Daphnia magna]
MPAMRIAQGCARLPWKKFVRKAHVLSTTRFFPDSMADEKVANHFYFYEEVLGQSSGEWSAPDGQDPDACASTLVSFTQMQPASDR